MATVGLSQRRRYGEERELGGGYTADESDPSLALHGVAAPLYDAVRWTVKLPAWCSSATVTLWRYSELLDVWARDREVGTITASWTDTQPLAGDRVWYQLTDIAGTPDTADPVRKSWRPIAEEM